MERIVNRKEEEKDKKKEQVEDLRMKQIEKEKTSKENLQMEKSWHEETTEIEADELGINAMSSQTSEWIKTHVKNGDNLKNKNEKNIKKKKEKQNTGMKKLKSWFWEEDSTDESEISSEEGENTDEETWEGVERRKRNKVKREKQKKRKNKIEEVTAEKASKMIGLGPITKESIDYFENKGHNFENAKNEAAKEYLAFFLKFSEKEIEKLQIVGTQLAPKDDILYLALNSTQGYQGHIHQDREMQKL